MKRIKPLALLCFGALVIVGGQSCTAGHDRQAKAVEAVTHNHTRLVWLQDTVDRNDVFASGRNLRLMGYDSRDGRGERVILDGPDHFHKPLLTRDGNRILYSRVDENRTYLVDWEGGNPQPLADGMVLATWQDPADGRHWIYIGRDRNDERGYSFGHMIRLPLDDPAAEERVWDRTPIQIDNVQLSADGRRACGLFPWPESGFALLDENEVQRVARGCWTGMAPDNSYVMWTFDGSHRNFIMHDQRSGQRWDVNVSRSPGIGGHETYHPRWSNHPDYFVLTGPYTIRAGGNNIRGGGPDVEIHIGQFSPDRREILQWVQVTDNDYANFHPDLWIAGVAYTAATDETEKADAPPPPSDATASDAWPITEEGLIFRWQNREANNEWRDPAGERRRYEPEPVGQARYGRALDMDLRQGYFQTPNAGPVLLYAWSATEQLSVEMVATPVTDWATPKPLLAVLDDTHDFSLRAYAATDYFFLSGQVGPQTPQAKFEWSETWTTNQPKHLMLALHGDEATLYVNGEPLATHPFAISPSTPSDKAHLYWGGYPQATHTFPGFLEGLTIYQRALPPPLIQQKAKAYLQIYAQRPAPQTLTVRARLTAASAIPQPDDIAPYRRGLVANEYVIERVLDGELDAERLLIAHWVILDGTTLDTAKRRVGDTFTLRIEAFDDRPELEGERLSMDSEDWLLDLFFDIDS